MRRSLRASHIPSTRTGARRARQGGRLALKTAACRSMPNTTRENGPSRAFHPASSIAHFLTFSSRQSGLPPASALRVSIAPQGLKRRTSPVAALLVRPGQIGARRIRRERLPGALAEQFQRSGRVRATSASRRQGLGQHGERPRFAHPRQGPAASIRTTRGVRERGRRRPGGLRRLPAAPKPSPPVTHAAVSIAHCSPVHHASPRPTNPAAASCVGSDSVPRRGQARGRHFVPKPLQTCGSVGIRRRAFRAASANSARSFPAGPGAPAGRPVMHLVGVARRVVQFLRRAGAAPLRSVGRGEPALGGEPLELLAKVDPSEKRSGGPAERCGM